MFLCEDTDFVFRFLSNATKIIFFNHSMYIHNLYKGKKNYNKATFGTKISLKHQLSFLKPIASCKKYFINKGDKFLKIKKNLNHCIAAYTIIYTIRSCLKIQSISDFFKTYKFWKQTYKKIKFSDALDNYSPKLAEGGYLLPYLIKNKIYLIAIIIAYILARKRYL